MMDDDATTRLMQMIMQKKLLVQMMMQKWLVNANGNALTLLFFSNKNFLQKKKWMEHEK